MIGVVAATVTGAATVLTIQWERRSRNRSRWAKMVASTGFIVVAVAAGAFESSFGLLVLSALALSWIGDLLLTYTPPRMFLAGLVAFLLGHLAYVAAFAVRGLDTVAAGVAVAGVGLLGALILSWLMPHVGDDLRTAVLAYTVVISLMVAAAVGTNGYDPDWRIPFGAVLFYASDLFVARARFVAPGIINRRIGLPLYYAGQLLLAWAGGG
jgi:uncharacterized membrane protein YhhN